MFRLYWENGEFDGTGVQSDASVLGEHFINFPSTIMTSRLMDRFFELGFLGKMTSGEVMGILRRGFIFKDGFGNWIFRAQTDKEVLGPWTLCRGYRRSGDADAPV